MRACACGVGGGQKTRNEREKKREKKKTKKEKKWCARTSECSGEDPVLMRTLIALVAAGGPKGVQYTHTHTHNTHSVGGAPRPVRMRHRGKAQVRPSAGGGGSLYLHRVPIHCCVYTLPSRLSTIPRPTTTLPPHTHLVIPTLIS